jgi:DnaK suppressor protein
MSKLTGEREERLVAMLREKKRAMWNELRDDLYRQTGRELQTQYELPQDLGDRGIIDVLEDTGLALAEIRQEELIQLEEAERKLQDGSFGFCAECGTEISEERLALLPFATCCVACQTLREGPVSVTRSTL